MLLDASRRRWRLLLHLLPPEVQLRMDGQVSRLLQWELVPHAGAVGPPLQIGLRDFRRSHRCNVGRSAGGWRVDHPHDACAQSGRMIKYWLTLCARMVTRHACLHRRVCTVNADARIYLTRSSEQDGHAACGQKSSVLHLKSDLQRVRMRLSAYDRWCSCVDESLFQILTVFGLRRSVRQDLRPQRIPLPTSPADERYRSSVG